MFILHVTIQPSHIEITVSKQNTVTKTEICPNNGYYPCSLKKDHEILVNTRE